jgi:H2-forming N5,N10-methylenetetrahydromethanopterin dehydrogenase-like enzyme
MGKKDKITLALRNKQRLKNAASALRMQYSELVDLALDAVLDDLEEDIRKAQEVASPHLQRASQKLGKQRRTIQGNSAVQDALKASREAQGEGE